MLRDSDRYLFWTHTNELANVILPQDTDVPSKYFECMCVDMNYTGAHQRYGYFTEKAWIEVPLDKFPPEFRTHLLLLGVP